MLTQLFKLSNLRRFMWLGLIWVMLLKVCLSFGAESLQQGTLCYKDHEISKERVWAIEKLAESFEETDQDEETDKFHFWKGAVNAFLKIHQIKTSAVNLGQSGFELLVRACSPPLYQIFCLYRI